MFWFVWRFSLAAVVAVSLFALVSATRNSLVPTEPPCWQGLILSRHVSDRIVYSDGSAQSRWPLEYWLVVAPLDGGPSRVLSTGADDSGYQRAAVAEPGSLYSTCPSPVEEPAPKLSEL